MQVVKPSLTRRSFLKAAATSLAVPALSESTFASTVESQTSTSHGFIHREALFKLGQKLKLVYDEREFKADPGKSIEKEISKAHSRRPGIAVLHTLHREYKAQSEEMPPFNKEIDQAFAAAINNMLDPQNAKENPEQTLRHYFSSYGIFLNVTEDPSLPYALKSDYLKGKDAEGFRPHGLLLIPERMVTIDGNGQRILREIFNELDISDSSSVIPVISARTGKDYWAGEVQGAKGNRFDSTFSTAANKADLHAYRPARELRLVAEEILLRTFEKHKKQAAKIYADRKTRTIPKKEQDFYFKVKGRGKHQPGTEEKYMNANEAYARQLVGGTAALKTIAPQKIADFLINSGFLADYAIAQAQKTKVPEWSLVKIFEDTLGEQVHKALSRPEQRKLKESLESLAHKQEELTQIIVDSKRVARRDTQISQRKDSLELHFAIGNAKRDIGLIYQEALKKITLDEAEAFIGAAEKSAEKLVKDLFLS